MTTHSNSMACRRPRRGPAGALARALPPARVPPGAARTVGCRPPAPHLDRLAYRHLLACGQPLNMSSMEANLGSEPASPSAMEPRACLCGSLRLIIITSEAGHEQRRLWVPVAGQDR